MVHPKLQVKILKIPFYELLEPVSAAYSSPMDLLWEKHCSSSSSDEEMDINEKQINKTIERKGSITYFQNPNIK